MRGCGNEILISLKGFPLSVNIIAALGYKLFFKFNVLHYVCADTVSSDVKHDMLMMDELEVSGEPWQNDMQVIYRHIGSSYIQDASVNCRAHR